MIAVGKATVPFAYLYSVKELRTNLALFSPAIYNYIIDLFMISHHDKKPGRRSRKLQIGQLQHFFAQQIYINGPVVGHMQSHGFRYYFSEVSARIAAVLIEECCPNWVRIQPSA